MTNNDKQAASDETMPRNGKSRQHKPVEQSLRLLGFNRADAIIKRWRQSRPPDDPGTTSAIDDYFVLGPGITADFEFIVVSDICGVWSLSGIQVKVVLNSARSSAGFSIFELQFLAKTAPLPTRDQIIRQATEWVVAEIWKERTYLLSALRDEFERLGFPDCSLFIWQPSTGRIVGSFRHVQQVGENGETVAYSFTPAMEVDSDTIVIASATIAFFRTWPDRYDWGSSMQKTYRRADVPIPSRDMMIWQLLSKMMKSFAACQPIKRSYAAGFKESRLAIADTRRLLARHQSVPEPLSQNKTISQKIV